MLIRSESSCHTFTANDGCSIKELLHPARLGIELGFSLAVAEVAAGESTFRHVLSHDEVYYLIAGRGRMHIDDDTQMVQPGDAVMIPRNSVQWIENTGDETLKFVAIVSPPWSATIDRRLDQ